MTETDATAHGNVELRSHGRGPPRVVVHGELDLDSVAEFRDVGSAVVGARALVIDLTDCTFIDSCGLGALIGEVRRVHGAGGRVVVSVCEGSPIRQSLRHAGVGHLAPVVVHGCQSGA